MAPVWHARSLRAHVPPGGVFLCGRVCAFTSGAAQADLHCGLQTALIVEQVRQVVVNVWNLQGLPTGQLLQQLLSLIWKQMFDDGLNTE